MNESKRQYLTLRDALAIMLIWAIATIVQLHVRRNGLETWSFPDPDDALRLVQVRDWLAGQSWFDVTQYRIRPPDGVPMHWSRLVDLPIGAAIELLGLATSRESAERIAVVAIPALTHLIFLFGVFTLALNVSGRKQVALVACLLASLAVGISAQFLPMRIDHHGAQIVLTIIGTSLLFDSARPRLNASLAGLLMAVAMVISIESLPLTLAMAGVLAVRYLRDTPPSPAFATYLASLSIGCIVLLTLSSKLQWLTLGVCDSTSSVYVAPIVVMSCGVALVTYMQAGSGRAARAGGLLLVAVATLGTGALIGPGCLHGPFSGLNPLVRDFWFANVKEGLPLWHQSAPNIVLNLLGSGLGIAGSCLAGLNDRPDRRRVWAELLILQIAALIVSLMVNRATAVAHALALPGNAWLLFTVFAWSVQQTGVIRRVCLVALSLLLIPQVSLLFALLVMEKLNDERGHSAPRVPKCLSAASITQLKAIPKSLLFAPLDVGPAILVNTDHSVVATGHHRNQRGILSVISGFTSSPDIAEGILRSTGSRFVAYCASLAEAKLYSKRFPHSLAAALSAGTPPAWLKPVDVGTGGFRIYKITEPESAGQ